MKKELLFKLVEKFNGAETTLLELSNDLTSIIGYDFLDHISEEEIINNGSVSVSDDGKDYNIEFDIVGELNGIKTAISITDVYPL